MATGPVECVGVFDGHRGSAVAAHVAEAITLESLGKADSSSGPNPQAVDIHQQLCACNPVITNMFKYINRMACFGHNPGRR